MNDADRRDAIARTARDFQRSAHQAGNTALTLDQAQARVAEAVRRGDRKRDNRNR